jgi:phosphoribosylanthranilate isomerase
MWIKICGMTDAAAVRAACEAGADALGFVFAPSVRRLEPEAATALAAPARGRLLLVAVTLRPEQQQVERILAQFQPDALQGDWHALAKLRLPANLALLPVYRDAVPTSPAALPPRLLFEGAHSGSGRTADWDAAAMLARRTALVLAGGLDAQNVGEANGCVRPFGVDVSSGVELQPGRKDPTLIARFVATARDCGGTR